MLRRLLGAMLRPPAAETKSLDRAWQYLLEAGQFERHFNQLQATYRALASTWLLATFAGIGFTIVNAKNIQSIPIDWLLMAAGVSIAGAIGIGLIWNLDLLVYHRLLDVIFHTARYIEEYHPGTAPFRINMMGVTRSGGVIKHVVWFYILGVDLLLIIGTVAISLELSAHQLQWPAAVVGGLVAVIAVTAFMQWMTARYRRAIRRFFLITETTAGTSMERWSAQTDTWIKSLP